MAARVTVHFVQSIDNCNSGSNLGFASSLPFITPPGLVVALGLLLAFMQASCSVLWLQFVKN